MVVTHTSTSPLHTPHPLQPRNICQHNTHSLPIELWQAYLNGSEMLSALARTCRTVGNLSISTLRIAVEKAIQLHGRHPNEYTNPLTVDVNFGKSPPQDECVCYDGLIRYYYATPVDEGGRTLSIQLDLYDAQVWLTSPTCIPTWTPTSL